MSHILLSWLDPLADFHQTANETDRAPRVRDDGPNYLLHAHHYHPQGYERHVLLYSEPVGTHHKYGDAFAKRIKREFSRNQLTVEHMALKSPSDLSEVKSQVAALLTRLASQGASQLDLYFSTGTAAMILGWYICHEMLKLPTRLITFAPPKFGYYQESPVLIEVRVDQSPLPLAATIRQQAVDNPVPHEGPILTGATTAVYEQATDVAAADCRVIIYGETGTGKELLARHIHNNSSRKDKPFVALNCGALAKGTLEAQLFGYKKGAFTGAEENSKGLFEQANGGTLLLDEIGEISPEMQVALLRVLQERKVRRLQDDVETPVDVRVIAATHRDLLKEAKLGNFRIDLFYRLAIIELYLPPMCQYAPADRQFMLEKLLAKGAELYNHPPMTLAPDALAYLLAYPYYGNIREMEGVVASIYVLAGRTSIIDLAILRQTGICTNLERRRDAFEAVPDLSPRQAAERDAVIQALRTATTLKEAADQLDMGSVNTLKARIKELGLPKEQFPNIRWRS